ncbi:LPS assembly lipoprotein LptE [Aquincola sp. MAHUQ-54]|uniref:LPS-assembly lipoprotein LptE n=1 Tax=Aquincola agrisoli TaxID=3119538 RepID=A0AAW9QH05_9BURK
MRRLHRRAWLAGLGASALAAGCGFQLQRPPVLPFRSIAFTGFSARSPLAAELRSRVGETRISEIPAQAEVILHALSDRRERSVVATTAAGQVREVQLRVRLNFRVTAPGGRVLLPPSELLLTRDMTYNETAALAKEQEEAQLYRAMESDIAQQIMRRLAALQPDAGR